MGGTFGGGGGLTRGTDQNADFGSLWKTTTYWPLDERLRSSFAKSCKTCVIIYKI